jgi:hypothetical protein
LKYFHPITPTLTSIVKSFCLDIVPEVEPIYVDVKPESEMEKNQCFPNVNKYIVYHDGSIVYGWSIWIFPTLFIEAEFHGIWSSPKGTLIDITPKEYPTKKILFLKDADLIFDGRQRKNRRKALQVNHVILGYLEAFDREYELKNRGERAFQTGEIQLEPHEQKELYLIEQMKEDYALQLMALHPNIGPYDPCPCGSGQKVKWCCGFH